MMPSRNCSFHALRPKVGGLDQSHGRCASAMGGMVCHTRIDGTASKSQSSSALLMMAEEWMRKARGVMQERQHEGYDIRSDIVRTQHLQRKRAVLVLLAALQLLADVRQLLRGGSQQLPTPLLGLRRESSTSLLRLSLDQRGWRLAVQPTLACASSN